MYILVPPTYPLEIVWFTTFLLPEVQYYYFIRLKLSHLQGSGEKQRKNVKKILVVAKESNPGTLVLATSTLTTELRQPTTFKTLTF